MQTRGFVTTSPKTPQLLPLSLWKENMQTWPQQMSMWALASPSLIYFSLDLGYLDNSTAFILSQVPVRWFNSQSSFLKSKGIYLEGCASVVVDEQLLCTVCYSGQSPLVVLTVLKTIKIFKSLIIIILAFEKLCSQKRVTIW